MLASVLFSVGIGRLSAIFGIFFNSDGWSAATQLKLKSVATAPTANGTAVSLDKAGNNSLAAMVHMLGIAAAGGTVAAVPDPEICVEPQRLQRPQGVDRVVWATHSRVTMPMEDVVCMVVVH